MSYFRKKKYNLGGAIEIKGPRHEKGGVPLHGKEVEGGETVQYIGEKKVPYVFSDRLRVPGSRETFADRHKSMTARGATTREVLQLMQMQEKLNGPTGEKMVLGGLIPYIPAAINVARGLFGKDRTPPPRFVDRSALRHLEKMDTEIDVEPQLEAINQQTRNIQADPAASTAQKLIAHAGALRGTSEVLANKENVEAGLRNEQLSQLARTSSFYDVQDQRTRAAYDDARAQSRAARSNILGTGLAQLSGIYQQGQANKIGLAAATAEMDPNVRAEFMNRIGLGGPSSFRTNPLYQRLRVLFQGSAPPPATPVLPDDYTSVTSTRLPVPTLG